jgi:hypothetical protein
MWTQNVENDTLKARELSNAQKQIESFVIMKAILLFGSSPHQN